MGFATVLYFFESQKKNELLQLVFPVLQIFNKKIKR
jgi:hypothetical protein